MLIAIDNKDVALLCFTRKTADVVPDDIEKACGTTKEAKDKCVKTVVYKSMCSRVLQLLNLKHPVVVFLQTDILSFQIWLER